MYNTIENSERPRLLLVLPAASFRSGRRVSLLRALFLRERWIVDWIARGMGKVGVGVGLLIFHGGSIGRISWDKQL